MPNRRITETFASPPRKARTRSRSSSGSTPGAVKGEGARLADEPRHRAHFDGICRGLALSGAVVERAWACYLRIASHRITPLPDTTKTVRADQVWAACALFAALVQEDEAGAGSEAPRAPAGSSSSLPRPPLTGILTATGVSFNDFMEHATVVFRKLGLGRRAELEALKERFLCAQLLWGKFRDLWDDGTLWSGQDRQRRPPSRSAEIRNSARLRPCAWLLFCLAKRDVVGEEPDLSRSYHVLAAVLHRCFARVVCADGDAETFLTRPARGRGSRPRTWTRSARRSRASPAPSAPLRPRERRTLSCSSPTRASTPRPRASRRRTTRASRRRAARRDGRCCSTRRARLPGPRAPRRDVHPVPRRRGP